MIDIEKLGLKLTCDFITLDEELAILNKITKYQPKNTKNRNSIQRYGSSDPYKSNMVSKNIPAHFEALCEKLVVSGLLDIKPNSVTVNEYFTGQNITPHIDSKESGEVITVLSLASEATMVLTLSSNRHTLVLPPRSVAQMRDEVRNIWKHSIEPVAATRYSIVFRHGRS